MEILVLILLIAVIALLVQYGNLRQRLLAVERRLDGRETERVGRPFVVEAATAEAPVAFEEPEPEPEPVFEAVGESRETLAGLFERLVAGKLLIWLGGIALVLAAVFLIRYSIEVGLVTPAARMVAAALFGLALLAAGEYARGRRFADDPRIAQVLVGAGIAVLYAACYGSQILYALIDSRTAFAGMAAVTVAALGLSLRHGAPTAAMGLVGGFLTPLLVGDADAGAPPLLAYLALLDIALFLLAWRRGWTWLAAAATLASFVWTLSFVAQPGTRDPLLAGGFAAALAILAAAVRPGPGRQLLLVQPLLIGLVQLGLLVARTDLGAPALLLFGALASAVLVLAALRRELWPGPPAALMLALALLWWKAAVGPAGHVPAMAVGIGLLFGGGGLALVRRTPGPLWTGLCALGLAGPWLLVRAMRPEYLERPLWGALAAALALGPVLLIGLQRGRARVEAPADLALLAAGAGAALLAGAAVWDLVAADWVAAGWLAVALALALAARRLGDLALGTVAVGVVLIGLARVLWTLPELSAAWLNALVGVPVLAADLPGALRALAALAIPALLLTAIRLALPPLPMRARRGLPILAGLLAAAALYLWFKQAFGLADHEDFVRRGLAERTLITQALFVAGWLLGAGIVRPPRLDAEEARLGGALLTALAALRLVWFDLALFNPAWTDQRVGTLPVLNLIVPAYLLGAFWLYLARRRAGNGPDAWPWFISFLAALAAGIALLVRQAFQGPILPGGVVGNAEAYGYSLAFLLLSVAVILAGVRLADKALRLAGLVLLTATLLKVFLVDAAALTGVLRILSFLLLGIALIGIGRLYGPILRAEQRDGAR